jgi:hypothetical protein
MENSKSLSRAGWIGLGVLLVGLVTLGVVFLIYRNKNKKKPQTNEDYVQERTTKPNNEEQKQTFAQIFNYIVGLGFTPEFANTLAAVSAHETGRWTSELAQKYNNIYGMKSGGSGKGLQTGEASGYAVYPNWETSIEDTCEWFKAKGYPVEDLEMTTDNILQWMKTKKYFEDSLVNYKKAVLSLKKELMY